jgi:amidase
MGGNDEATGGDGVPPNDIVELDAVSLSKAIANMEVSCREVMEATLAQIDRLNPIVNAIVSLRDRDELIHEADERDRQLIRGESMGWMHGFPQAPKDLAYTKGLVTTSGSPLMRDYVPTEDSIVVERARRAGAIIIGKTNTPEFGLGGNTYNTVFGRTGNSFEPDLCAGGSSGGTSVAVSLRMLPVADGSDTMGSQRTPAAWNNVFSLRPSFGRVPFGPFADVFFHHLPTEGPQGRTVADVAMLLAVQAGFDPRSPLSLGEDPSAFAGSLERDHAGVRIGWLGDYGGYLPMESGMLGLTARALAHFETIGAEVAEVDVGFDMEHLWEAWLVLRGMVASATAASIGLDEDPSRRAFLKPEALWEIDNGARYSAADVARATAVRTAWYVRLTELFDRYDFLVLPTTQVFAFDGAIHWPDSIEDRQMDTYHRWIEISIGGTMGAGPVANVPAGFDARGVPIGIQILGPARADLAVLQLAYAYEHASGYARRRSPLLRR